MAEILGAVASATQLVSVCFTLMNQLERIKGASSTLSKYRQQLVELHNLSNSISINPLLQSPEIETQTQALISLIQDNCLYSLLRRGKFWRSVGFAYKERDLLDVLTDLERRKATLSLVIENIQAQTLYQIHQDITNMADSSTPARASATGDAFQPASTIPSTALVRNAKPNHPPYPSVQDTEKSTYEPKPTFSGQYYERHTSGPGVDQILGVRVEVDGDLMSSIHNLKVMPGVYEYKDCTKVGPGTQVSGVDMKVFGKAEDGIVYPTMNYRSTGIHAEKAGVDTQGQETKTYQIPGGRLRVVHKNQDK